MRLLGLLFWVNAGAVLLAACGGSAFTESGTGAAGSGGTISGQGGGQSVGGVGAKPAGGATAGGSGGTTAIGGTGGGTTSSGGVPSSGGALTGGAAGAPSPCNPPCDGGFKCCGTTCINPNNDINNCGDCNRLCGSSPDSPPFCDNGHCGVPACNTVDICLIGQFCCGTFCCTQGQLCCDIPGPVASVLQCTDPVGGTCPTGCSSCRCASADTPIATPSGERAIAALRGGDLVYSQDRGVIQAVPIARTHREPSPRHVMVEAVLANGVVLHISAGHPIADGKTFGDLGPGDKLGSVRVLALRTIQYAGSYTYDILPASDSGTYLAGGALVGSTLR